MKPLPPPAPGDCNCYKMAVEGKGANPKEGTNGESLKTSGRVLSLGLLPFSILTKFVAFVLDRGTGASQFQVHL